MRLRDIRVYGWLQITVGLLLFWPAVGNLLNPPPFDTIGRISAYIAFASIFLLSGIVLIVISPTVHQATFARKLILRCMAVVGLLTVFGFAGLQIAYIYHPNSNLLGGYALIFFPFYQLGWFALPLGLMFWAVTHIKRQKPNENAAT